MIIFGSKGYKNHVGTSKLSQTCSHCNNFVTYEVFEVGRKFSLFFIPLFPISKKEMVLCPICNYGYEVTKENRDQLI